jgi:hypothetical protein
VSLAERLRGPSPGSREVGFEKEKGGNARRGTLDERNRSVAVYVAMAKSQNCKAPEYPQGLEEQEQTLK